MRSVNVERKPRKPGRGQAVRPSTRSKRDLPEVQPGTARKSKDAGGLANLGARFAPVFKRPMFALSTATAVCTFSGSRGGSLL